MSFDYTGNTLLHIFGNWLFEAALWKGQDSEGFVVRQSSKGSTSVMSSAADLTRIQDTSSSTGSRLKEYESGQAQAFIALCRIFTRQETGEKLLPIYLARFYHCLAIGLQYDPQVHTSISFIHIEGTITIE